MVCGKWVASGVRHKNICWCDDGGIEWCKDFNSGAFGDVVRYRGVALWRCGVVAVWCKVDRGTIRQPPGSVSVVEHTVGTGAWRRMTSLLSTDGDADVLERLCEPVQERPRAILAVGLQHQIIPEPPRHPERLPRRHQRGNQRKQPCHLHRNK